MNRTQRKRGLVLLLVPALALVCLALWFLVLEPSRAPAGAIRVPHDVPTLAEAVRLAKPGGTIALDGRAGPYAGSVDLDVPGVTLCSYAGRADVRSQGSGPTLALRADGVVVRGLRVLGGAPAVLVTAAACRVEDVITRDTEVGLRLSGARETVVRRIDAAGGAVGLDIASSSGTAVSELRLRDLSQVGLRHASSSGTNMNHLQAQDSAVAVSIESASQEVRLTGLAARGCATAGVVVRDATGVEVSRSRVQSAAVGVRFERVSGCSVHDCAFADTEEGAVLLVQSLESAVRANAIRTPGSAGIRLRESAENAVTDNRIVGGSVAGIALEASDRCLVASNAVRGTPLGIHVARTASALILRNEVGASVAGLLVVEADGCLVLQNAAAGGTVGVGVVASSGARVVRNAGDGASGAAFALIGCEPGLVVRQNEATGSGIGFACTALAACDLLDNRAARNDVGVFVARCAALRCEGNAFLDNGTGLRLTDTASGLAEILGALGAEPAGSSPGLAPSLSSNTFRDNRELDIENQGQATLYAAGNFWARVARVSGDVALDDSAWQPRITLAAGPSDVDAVVGAVLARAFAAAGYHVASLVGLADPAAASAALVAVDADIALVGTQPAAGATSFALPARAGWTVVVAEAVAGRLVEPTLSALAAALRQSPESLLWAAPLSLDPARLAALWAAYDFPDPAPAVAWAASRDAAESLLAFGASQIAVLDSLEETKSVGGFVALLDDLGALPTAPLAVLAGDAFLTANPSAAGLLSQVASRLTSPAVHDLVIQVRLLDRSPEEAAAAFLAGEEVTRD